MRLLEDMKFATEHGIILAGGKLRFIRNLIAVLVLVGLVVLQILLEIDS